MVPVRPYPVQAIPMVVGGVGHFLALRSAPQGWVPRWGRHPASAAGGCNPCRSGVEFAVANPLDELEPAIRAEHKDTVAETEDHVIAVLALSGGATVQINARVDHPGPPAHELILHLTDGRRLHVRGRNLEAGLGEIAAAPTHEELRRAMYAAALNAAEGHPAHPCLFSMTALRRPLEVIDRVYRDARVVRTAYAAAA